MKTRLFSGFLGLSAALLLASCSSEDINSIDTMQEADVMFSLNIADAMSKAVEAGEGEGCKNESQLQDYVAERNLEAVFTVDVNGEAEGGEKSYTNKIRFVNGDFIVDPIPLPKGTSVLTSLIISIGDTDNPIYSAISESSDDFLKQIAGEGNRLPLQVEVTSEDLATKKTFPVVVACTENRTPQDFGFKMWDIRFMHFYNYSFMVDDFDDENGHYVASGNLEIYKGKNEDGSIKSDGKALATIEFDGKGGDMTKLPKFWFGDDSSINNSDEYYYYKLTTYEEPVSAQKVTYRTFEGGASVADLLNYSGSGEVDNAAWLDDYDCFDFDLFNGYTWFLEETTSQVAE